MNNLLRLALGITFSLAPAVVSARVHAPRVVSPHNADAYSMKTFSEFHRWNDLVADERAWEVYQYLSDVRTGVFHMNEVLEGNESFAEYATVRDPVKIINVYGYGYCGIFGPMMAGVCQGVALGPARSLILNDWHHVASEVFYNHRWHYLDVDVRAVFRQPDGVLASFDDARKNASLWTGRGPRFFPNDDLKQTRKTYETTPYYYHYGFHQSGHTMDYVLRQGESFTRWWTPQDGRWHHLPVYHESAFMRRLIESPPRGPAPNHRDFTVHNYGNGRFVYHPNLTSRSSDFADGIYDYENVVPATDGLILESPGPGYVTFEMHTPYIIVPKVNRLETRDDDREASVVEIDATDSSMSISRDNGRSWLAVGDGSATGRYDLTRHVAGTYGYLLRVELNRRNAHVKNLQITTWVQVAPAALPSIRSGQNVMELRLNDHHGLPSQVVTMCSDTSNPQHLRRQVVDMPSDYDPQRDTERVRGQLVAHVISPPRTRIAWFTAEGSFRTHQRAAASETRNAIAYAVDKPVDWNEIYRANVPTDMGHWHYNAAREIELAHPTKNLFVRYLGDPAVNNFRIYAHCVEDSPRPKSPVVITHAWTDRNGRQVRQVKLDRAGPYVIEAGADPVDESIEIAVASDDPTATPY